MAAPRWQRLLWLVPGVIGALMFAGSINNGFAVDDAGIIEENEVVHDGSMGRIFSTDYWVARGSQGKLYRPLTILTYAWNHAVGGLNPWGYHFVNVLLHAVVCMLVFAVVRALGATIAVALVSGVLYAVHPIHVEAVSNIVGRAELLSTCGVLAALLWYINACRAPDASHRLRLHVLSVAAFTAAIFCKENAITFLVIPAMYDALFTRSGSTTAWGAVRQRLGWHIAYAAVALVYLIVRDAVLGGLTIETIGFEDNPIAGLSPGTRILTAIALVARYAGLMVFPKTLSYVYGPGAITPVTSVSSPMFLAGAALLAGLVVLIVWAWRRVPFLAFWGGFALVTFSIVSNIVVPIGTAFAERLLYLPSVGLLALAGWGLVRLVSLVPGTEAARRGALAGIVIVIGVACAWRSFVRDLDWRSNRDLFLAQDRTPVRSSQTTFNAGLMHFQDKTYEKALPLFTESVELHPTAKALYFVGRAHGALGNDAERVRVYTETADRFPGSFHGEMARGWLLTQKDQYAEALPHFAAAVKRTPSDGSARLNLGVSLFRTNDLRGAIEVLTERSDRGEMLAERRDLLAKAYEGMGNDAAAAEVRANRIPAVVPEKAPSPSLVPVPSPTPAPVSTLVPSSRTTPAATVGYNLWRKGKLEEAKKAFMEALAADPKDVSARRGLGVVAYNLGEDVTATAVLGALRAEKETLDESSYLALASAYQRQERNRETLEILEEAVTKFSNSTQLVERLAFLEYTVFKNYAPAANHFRQLLRIAPDHPKKSEIQPAIEWLERRGY